MPRFNTPIEFYFDFVSSFGYFASLRVDDFAARHGRSVDWYAIRLGVSVVKIMGLKPLLETPLKGAYLVREAGRCAPCRPQCAGSDARYAGLVLSEAGTGSVRMRWYDP